MAKVEFVAIEAEDGVRDGGEGYRVEVDGKVVIDQLRNRDMDIGSYALNPLWAALGATVGFDYD